MNYMHNVWKLNAIRFFYNLIPAYVIERLFWELKGMTIQLVVYTEIIYAITIIIFEIPTGILADKWGRKKMLILTAFFGCIEFIILIYATTFWHFAVIVFLAGVGGAANSGSENALLYDSLVSNNETPSFEKYLGKLNAYDLSAAIIAALSGSLMANHFGFEFNYWISFVAVFISLCLTFTLAEPELKVKMNESIAIKEYIKISISFFKRNPNVCLVLVSGMIIGASLNFIDEFWQLYISRLGIPVIYFGLFSAGLMLFRLPGYLSAYLIKKWISYRSLILGVTFIFAAGCLFLSISKGFAGLAVVYLICIVSGIIEPIASGYLHNRVESQMRATIDSFRSLGLRVSVIIAALGFGYFSSKFDIFGGYGFISFICFIYFSYFLFTSKNIVE